MDTAVSMDGFSDKHTNVYPWIDAYPWLRVDGCLAIPAAWIPMYPCFYGYLMIHGYIGIHGCMDTGVSMARFAPTWPPWMDNYKQFIDEFHNDILQKSTNVNSGDKLADVISYLNLSENERVAKLPIRLKEFPYINVQNANTRFFYATGAKDLLETT